MDTHEIDRHDLFAALALEKIEPERMERWRARLAHMDHGGEELEKAKRRLARLQALPLSQGLSGEALLRLAAVAEAPPISKALRVRLRQIPDRGDSIDDLSTAYAQAVESKDHSLIITKEPYNADRLSSPMPVTKGRTGGWLVGMLRDIFDAFLPNGRRLLWGLTAVTATLVVLQFQDVSMTYVFKGSSTPDSNAKAVRAALRLVARDAETYTALSVQALSGKRYGTVLDRQQQIIPVLETDAVDLSSAALYRYVLLIRPKRQVMLIEVSDPEPLSRLPGEVHLYSSARPLNIAGDLAPGVYRLAVLLSRSPIRPDELKRVVRGLSPDMLEQSPTILDRLARSGRGIEAAMWVEVKE